MDRNYENWTLAMIRSELKSRGAKTTGRKADCVARLEAYDRNQNFGDHNNDSDTQTPGFRMQLPSMAEYKDLNTESKVPKLTAAAANQYLLPFDKALGKKNKLSQSRFMRYIRWASADGKVFMKGNCRAEMRKTVTYDTDLLMDKNGNIRLAQCDCAAGMGPSAHCKHIVCLLFCLVNFCLTGQLNIELTCTDKLQTFHRVKKFSGSPVKMGRVSSAKKSGGGAVKSVAKRITSNRFDPRKPKYVQKVDYLENYNECIKNKITNFVGDMTLAQLVVPANPYALHLDHDYHLLNFIDYFLNHIRVTSITPNECLELEESTRGQSNNNMWKEQRLLRLQSSNFGRICKATERTDLDTLANNYTDENKINTAAIRHGRTYEKEAIHKYENETGRKVQECGIFVQPMHPYIGSSPDGIVDDNLLVEVKCPYVARDKLINSTNIPYLQDENGQLTLNKKHDYYFQIQGQLYCAERQVCDLVIYTKADMKIFQIQRDAAFIDIMLTKLKSFFDFHFKPALLNKYVYRDYCEYNFAAKWSPNNS